MKNRVTLLNILSSVLLQIVTVVSGFVVPRIILVSFGSVTNGLVASLNQFLGYIALIEGGVTGVISANLFKPLVNNDQERISAVLTTARQFYNRVGYIFIAYTFALAVVYPLTLGLDFVYTSSLTVVLSLTLFIQYMFSLTAKTLLNTDKKVYVVSFTQILISILNVLLVIVSVKIYPQIHFLKLLSGLIYLVQPLVFSKYVKKHYNINWESKADNNLLRQRWNGFAINIAAFIHGGTDITVLTIFTDFQTVSVYSVYAIVSVGIKNLINSIASSISPTIGHAYAKGEITELNTKMDLFEYTIFVLTGILFTVAGLLITPFVILYTKGVDDAQYYQPIFGILLLLSEALYLVKSPHLSLAYAANKFKEISKHAYIEAGINIVVSVILVRKLGLVGIAIGTILAMLYRMAFHICYTKKLIPTRRQLLFYKKLSLTIIFSAITALVCYFTLPINELSFLKWIVRAIEYTGIVTCGYVVMSFLFFRSEVIELKRYITR